MFHFFFLRNSLGLHYPKSWQPRRVSWIFQLKTFSTSKIDRIQTSYRLLCKKRNPKEYPLKFGFHLQLQRRKRKKRKKSRVYTSFQEKFPGKREKNDVAETKERASGLARFANFFSRGSHATIKERNFPVVARGRHGSSPPRRCRRALAACTRVNVRMSQLNFLVSLFSPVQLACPTATLVAFHLTILSTKLRPAGDAEKAGRKRNGRRRGEGERRGRWKRGEQRIVPTGFTRSLWTGKRGDTSLVCEGGGRRYLAVCDSNNEGSLEVHSADVLSWAKLMRFLFLQFRCFVLDFVLASPPWTPNFFFFCDRNNGGESWMHTDYLIETNRF